VSFERTDKMLLLSEKRTNATLVGPPKRTNGFDLS